MKLIIVESPTKAKTIEKFLGKAYKIESSFGHVRDLPVRKIGVNVDDDFSPQYVVLPRAKKILAEFKSLVSKAAFVYLATDESANDFVNLGAVKATEGNVNYEVPPGTDLAKYHYVLTWCRQFSVLFNSADLAQQGT